MNKLRDFFPKAVYFCDCLQENIDNCLKPCSLQDICNEINKSDDTLIYCVRCGDEKQDIVFSCCNHMVMGTYTVALNRKNVTVIENTTGHYCLSCIKKYLVEKYYTFNCQIFHE